ncbi:MAG TPA: glycosyltransferase family 4 protein [Verrucomicrobiae bacterium]|nr:glycosyltransferase family 4 protein [Verrucomicrobiae bacterium]
MGSMQILLATCGGWHLPNTAKGFQNRDALAGLWITGKNEGACPPEKFRRCWPFHLAMKPFYHGAPQIWIERAFYAFFPVWRAWLKRQKWPDCDVVQAIMGYATEPFDVAEKIGALKVIDCPNSHPTTYFGHWQRECDRWCPGEKVPIPRWMFERMSRELERADLVLCPSNFVRDTMVQNGIPAGRCFVAPFGVDTGIFKPRPSPPTVPRFICVGTICLRKGHQYLFRAFEQVKQKLPDAELICVGNYKRDFRRERRRWVGTFTHRPLVSHPELAELLQTCSAFVLASVEEGFARVLSEAAAAGLPIIGTYESGASTTIADGVEGFIVRGRDPQQIAEAMIRVAANPSLNQKMGEAAHEKGAKKNTWQDYADRLLAEYARRQPIASSAKPPRRQ